MSSKDATKLFADGGESLRVIRRLLLATGSLGALTSLVGWAYLGWAWALGFAGGVLVGMLNLVFLTLLAREVLRLGRRHGGRIAALLALKIPLVYGGLAALLLWDALPLVAVVGGFSLLLLVVLLRVAGRALVDSGLLRTTAIPAEGRGTAGEAREREVGKGRQAT